MLDALITAALLASPCGSAPPTPPRTFTAQRADAGDDLHAFGSWHAPAVARPLREVTIGSPIDGRVAVLLVTPGSFVTAGTPIARFDDAVARAGVALAVARAEAGAAIERAEHALDLARIRAQRTEEAWSDGVTNELEVEEARAAVRIAASELLSAREARRIAECELERARAELAEHVVCAPFDGVVVARHTDVGASLSHGDPIVDFAALNRLRIQLDLPASAIDTLERGATYRFRADAPCDREILATLVRIDPVLDPATATARCVFDTLEGSFPVAGFTVRPVLDRATTRAHEPTPRSIDSPRITGVLDEPDA